VRPRKATHPTAEGSKRIASIVQKAILAHAWQASFSMILKTLGCQGAAKSSGSWELSSAIATSRGTGGS
jgi:hypothetical protein